MRSRTRWIVIAVAALLLGSQGAVRAQDFRCVGYQTFTANVPLTTTSETVIVSSVAACAPRPNSEVVVIAWAQLTTGTNTTAVTPRLRRGTTTSGTLLGEANAEQVKAAAGSTEPFWIMGIEERVNVNSVDYSLTLQQTAASADGSALAGAILVMVR